MEGLFQRYNYSYCYVEIPILHTIKSKYTLTLSENCDAWEWINKYLSEYDIRQMSDSSSVYNEVFDPAIHDNPTSEGNT